IASVTSGFSICSLTGDCNAHGGTCTGCVGVDAPSSCPPLGIPDCTNDRPSCTTGLNGDATASAHVHCDPANTPTATPTETPTNPPTATATATHPATATRTATVTHTATVTSTATVTATPTITPTATATPVPQGGACATPSQCGTGFCANGVCCDSACTDPS